MQKRNPTEGPSNLDDHVCSSCACSLYWPSSVCMLLQPQQRLQRRRSQLSQALEL